MLASAPRTEEFTDAAIIRTVAPWAFIAAVDLQTEVLVTAEAALDSSGLCDQLTSLYRSNLLALV